MVRSDTRERYVRLSGELFRLGKFKVYQHAFGPILAVTCVGTYSLRSLCTALLSVLAFQFMISCGCALDDLTGFRNGSDARNYLSGTEAEFSRKVVSKPLLSGSINERQVVVWAIFSMGVGILLGAASVVMAGGSAAGWAFLLMIVCALLVPHYSWGLRASYRPAGGELLLVATHALSLIWPLVAIGGTLSRLAVVEALLYGVSFLMVSMYSNENDKSGDRSVGRRTVAAAFGTTGTGIALATLVVVEICLALAGGIAARTGGFDFVVPLLLLPGIGLHIYQAWAGIVGGRWMFARSLGLKSMNVLFVGLIGANIALAI